MLAWEAPCEFWNWEIVLCCLLLGDLLFFFFSLTCRRPRPLVMVMGMPNEYRWGCKYFGLISRPFDICLSMFLSMQRDIYLSTFSLHPGFSRASKPIKLVLSMSASLTMNFRPYSVIWFPEMLITLMYLSRASARCRSFAKPSLNLFLYRMSSLRPAAYRMCYFL